MSIVAVLVLSAVLGTAGVMKLRRPMAFRVVLRQLLDDRVARPLAILVPAAEVLLAVVLLSGVSPRGAGLAAIVILGCFTLALLQMGRLGVSQDCGCFGEAREADSPMSGVIRNIGLLCLAVVLVVDPRPIWDASRDDFVAAGTIAVAATCLWLLVSTLVTRRSILFFARSEQ